MRRRSLFLCLAVVALYCAGWVVLAGLIKDQAYKNLDSLKASNVISSYSGDVKVTGFPFMFNIKFIHPRLQFRQPQVTGDLLFDGVFITNVSPFSSKIKLQLNGDLHFKASLNQRDFDLTLNAKDLTCRLALRHVLLISAIKASTGDAASLARLFKEASVQLSDLSLTNKLTNTTLVYTEDWHAYTEFYKSNAELKLHHKARATDTEFHPEFNLLADAVLGFPSIRHAVDKLDVNIRNYFAVFSLDKLGKINYEVDLLLVSNARESSLKIYKKLQDDLHDFVLSGKADLANKTVVDATFSGKFSPQWYSLMKIYANKLDLEHVLASNSQASSKSNSIFVVIFRAVTGFIKEAFLGKDDRAAYVPQLHEMGEIKADIALACEKLSTGFHVDIDTFKVSAQDMAVNLHGYIHSTERDTYELKAKLHNYQRIVTTAASYINRIASGMHHVFFISDKQLSLSPSIQEAIARFMHDVSDEPDSKSSDLSLTIINKDGGRYPSVGQYSSTMFERMWNNLIWKVVLGDLANKLNPEELSKLFLQSPIEISATLAKDVGQQAQKLAHGIVGALGGAGN